MRSRSRPAQASRRAFPRSWSIRRGVPIFSPWWAQKTLDEIRGWAETATIDETYFETEAGIRLDGAMHWCKLAIMVTWSSTEAGRYNSLVGVIRDIDEKYRRLTDVQEALPRERAQALTPMMSGAADDVLRVSKEQVDGLLAGYRRIFDIARLVDPGICVELTKRDEGYTLKKSEHCYAVWKKKRRCENCISQEVLRTHKPQTKIETRESDIYYVLASFIEVDGRPYSLELVKRIKSDDMFERENVLNQLLVRNRQVYMDSVTKVYNRRYYDERLKNLEGRFSFAMIDMDNFKHINDRFGHQAGDAALYRAAQAHQIADPQRRRARALRGAMNSSCCSATCRSKFWRRNCSPFAQRLTRSSSRSILNCTSARASAARSRRDASQERSAGRTLRCIRPN